MKLLKIFSIAFFAFLVSSFPWLRSVSATLASDEHMELIKDINPGIGDGEPYNYAAFNSKMYFQATDGTHGYELWVSDGTESGTSMLKDINSSGDSSPADLVVANNILFFSATDGVNGVELWKSDGTEGGTTRIKDIRSGSSSSSPSDLTVLGSIVYFYANDGTTGAELWKSDGTEAGTTLVKDINTGAGSSMSSFLILSPFITYNSTLFFYADNGTNGYELWKSDGTTGGTALLKDIRSGASGSLASTVFNGVNYKAISNGFIFTADDGSNGAELWFSDGTTGGTTLIKDINPGSGSSVSSFAGKTLFEFGGKIYVSADDGVHGAEPWVSDGTLSGTTLLKDIYSGSTGSGFDRAVEANSTLFFQASDGANGTELWKSDGTTGGTSLVKDINTSGDSYANPYAEVDGSLIFSAADDGTNFELWKSDGTTSGTEQIVDINPSGDAFPAYLFSPVLNNRIYLYANDGSHGTELWSYWVDVPTPTPTSTPGVTSTPTPTPTMSAECTTEKPKAPELFQVDRSGSSATIHFVPLSDSMTSYQLSYGTEESADGNSLNIDISRSDGAIAHKIESLDATKKYYFKVRAKKGCAEGEWSGVKSSINSNGESNSTISTLKKSTGTPQFNKISKKSAVVKKKINTAKQITKSLKKKSSLLTKPKSCFLFWCW